MPRAEFVEWRAYYQLEPWGPERADMRTAILASLIYHSRARDGKTAQVTDFLALKFLPLIAQEEARLAGGEPSPGRQRQVALLLRERFALLSGKTAKPPAKAR